MKRGDFISPHARPYGLFPSSSARNDVFHHIVMVQMKAMIILLIWEKCYLRLLNHFELLEITGLSTLKPSRNHKRNLLAMGVHLQAIFTILIYDCHRERWYAMWEGRTSEFQAIRERNTFVTQVRRFNNWATKPLSWVGHAPTMKS